MWEPDDARAGCALCSKTFTASRRRHHCRGCGKLACARCTARSLSRSKFVRCCEPCFDAANAVGDQLYDVVSIGTHEVPDEHSDRMAALCEETATLTTAIDADDLKEWTLMSHDVASGMKTYSKPPSKKGAPDVVCVRAEIRCPLPQFFGLWYDSDYAKAAEPMISSIEMLKRTDAHTYYGRTALHAVGAFGLGLGARDCVFLDHWRVLEDESVVVLEYSITDAAELSAIGLAATTPAHTRVSMARTSVHMRKTPHNTTCVTYYSDVDAKITPALKAFVDRLNAGALRDGLKKFQAEVDRRGVDAEAPPIVNAIGGKVKRNSSVRAMAAAPSSKTARVSSTAFVVAPLAFFVLCQVVLLVWYSRYVR